MIKNQVVKKIDNFYKYVKNRKEKFENTYDILDEDDNKSYTNLEMERFFNDLLRKITNFKARYELHNKLDYSQINIYIRAMNNGTHTSNHHKRTNLYRIKNKWMAIKREINTLIGDD